jgi:hypothetical protein
MLFLLTNFLEKRSILGNKMIKKQAGTHSGLAPLLGLVHPLSSFLFNTD